MVGLRSFTHQRMYMGQIEPTMPYRNSPCRGLSRTTRPDLTLRFGETGFGEIGFGDRRTRIRRDGKEP
jgi:hypothetical protein